MQFVVVVNAPPTNDPHSLVGFTAYGPYTSEAEAESAMNESHWDIDLRFIVLAELQSPEALAQRARTEGVSSDQPVCEFCKKPIGPSDHRLELIPAGSEGKQRSVVAHLDASGECMNCAGIMLNSGAWEVL